MSLYCLLKTRVYRRWKIFLTQTREAGKKYEKRERAFAFLWEIGNSGVPWQSQVACNES